MISQLPLLISGGSGFVGLNLINYLVNFNYEINILVRKDSTSKFRPQLISHNVYYHFIDNNFESINAVISKKKPLIVIHIASLYINNHTSDDILNLINSNILFASYLLESMRINSVVNFINTGTSWQHVNEFRNNPVNFYASTKNAFDSILDYYVDAYNLKVINLKLYDTYGIGDKRKKLINIIINHLINDNHLYLDMSLGDQLLDMVYIDDVVKAYEICINLLLNMDKRNYVNKQNFDLSSNQHFSIKSIIQLIEKISNKKLKIRFGALEYRFREVMTPNIGYNLPCWEASVTLNEGLYKILKYNNLI